jgi:pimeloyl-ACP methyl ester carboxylesterase
MSSGSPRVRAAVRQGSYATGENHVELVPRDYKRDNTKPAVLFLHPHGADAFHLCAPSGSNNAATCKLMNAVAEVLPVFCADLGTSTAGTTQKDSYGNTNQQARIGDVRTFAQGATGGAKTGKVVLVGVSMGWLMAVNYARNNPTNVAGMVGLIPASDLDDIRNNDRASLRSDIDLAEGVTYPAALPTGANPATASYSGITMPPSTVWYATDDTTVIPSTVTTLAGIIGSTTHSITNGGGHSNLTISAVPVDQFVSAVLTYAAAA